MGMETKRKRPSESLWNRGIGSVTQKERLGYSQRDQRFALYQCKVAQFKAQDGECGICGTPMDPKYAIWANPRKTRNPSLAKWAFGQGVEFNHETLCFDSSYRSPDEILAEYDGGASGYCLYHPWCMGKWRARSPGLHPGGPAWEREYDKAIEEGYNSLEAATLAVDRIRERNLATMAKAREDPKRIENWLTAMELGRAKKKDASPAPRPGKKKWKDPRGGEAVGNDWSSIPGFNGPEAEARRKAQMEYENSLPETDLERMTRELIESAQAAAKGG